MALRKSVNQRCQNGDIIGSGTSHNEIAHRVHAIASREESWVRAISLDADASRSRQTSASRLSLGLRLLLSRDAWVALRQESSSSGRRFRLRVPGHELLQ